MTIAAACHIPADTYSKDEKLHIRCTCSHEYIPITGPLSLLTKIRLRNMTDYSRCKLKGKHNYQMEYKMGGLCNAIYIPVVCSFH